MRSAARRTERVGPRPGPSAQSGRHTSALRDCYARLSFGANLGEERPQTDARSIRVSVVAELYKGMLGKHGFANNPRNGTQWVVSRHDRGWNKARPDPDEGGVIGGSSSPSESVPIIEPGWKTNPFWGFTGVGIGLLFTALGAILPPLVWARCCLFGAWPCFTAATLVFFNQTKHWVRSTVIVSIVVGGCELFIGIATSARTIPTDIHPHLNAQLLFDSWNENGPTVHVELENTSDKDRVEITRYRTSTDLSSGITEHSPNLFPRRIQPMGKFELLLAPVLHEATWVSLEIGWLSSKGQHFVSTFRFAFPPKEVAMLRPTYPMQADEFVGDVADTSIQDAANQFQQEEGTVAAVVAEKQPNGQPNQWMIVAGFGQDRALLFDGLNRVAMFRSGQQTVYRRFSPGIAPAFAHTLIARWDDKRKLAAITVD